MISKYLNFIAQKVKNTFVPKHPNYSRAFILPDGTQVVAETFEETEFDKVESVPATTVGDWIRTGQMPPKLGSMRPNAVITQAQFCEQFVDAFHAAGARDAAAAAAAAAKNVQPVEPTKTE